MHDFRGGTYSASGLIFWGVLNFAVDCGYFSRRLRENNIFIDILEFVCSTTEDKCDRQTGKNEQTGIYGYILHVKEHFF